MALGEELFGRLSRACGARELLKAAESKGRETEPEPERRQPADQKQARHYFRRDPQAMVLDIEAGERRAEAEHDET